MTFSIHKPQNNDDGVLAKIELVIRPTIFIVSLLVGCILIYLYITKPERREELIFIALIMGGLAAICSAFYTGRALRFQSESLDKQLKFQKEQADEQLKFQKETLKIQNRQFIVKNTYDLITAITGKEVVEMRHELLSKFNHDKTAPEEVYGKITADNNLHTALKTILNLYENISLAIQDNYIDEKIIYKNVSFILPWTYDTFKPYITKFRKKHNDPRIYCEIAKLSNAWEVGKYLSTDENIPTEDRKKDRNKK